MAKGQPKIAELITVEGVDCKGFGIIAKLVTTDTDLCIGSKALYAYLCSYAGNGTTAYPRRSKILADLKMSKETYYKYQKELLDQGYIRATRGDKYPFANTYTIVSRPPKLKDTVPPENASGDILIARGIKAMGYGTVPKAVMLDERLHYKAKALYAYFCSFAGNGTTAVPTRETICYHMQFTVNSFQRYIRQLIQFNYIEVQQTKYQGRFSNNIYYLNDLPDEGRGKQEIERRQEMQQRKAAAKNDGQAVIDTKNDKGGVNIDTPTEKRVNSRKTGDFVSQNYENSAVDEKAEADRLMTERNVYSEIIKDNIEYDILVGNESSDFRNLADVIFNIILDVVTANTDFIKIGKENKPKEVVKSRFLKLTYENVEYVIDSLMNTTTKIVNIPAYIRTSLYNSQTDNFYWHNQVKSDFGY